MIFSLFRNLIYNVVPAPIQAGTVLLEVEYICGSESDSRIDRRCDVLIVGEERKKNKTRPGLIWAFVFGVT